MKIDGISIRKMAEGEERAVADFVLRVFDRYLAHDYSAAGCAAVRDYNTPDNLARRSASNHRVWVAADSDVLVGVIEVRDATHVSMLFVEGSWQRSGIGRVLLERGVGEVIRRGDRVTLNSAPSAVGAYERFGFRAEAAEQLRDGIRFIPMSLQVGRAPDSGGSSG
jgi:GNAT superfamily N-acetyltransferase